MDLILNLYFKNTPLATDWEFAPPPPPPILPVPLGK
jgi:hypothetical protein